MSILNLTDNAILDKIETGLWQLRLASHDTLEVNPGKIDIPDNWFLFHRFYCASNDIIESDENLETLQAYLCRTDILDLHRVHAILHPIYERKVIPTAEEALEKLIKIWDYLARYRFADKIEPYIVYDLTSDKHYCPACQHALEIIEGRWTVNCNRCLLRSLWPFSRKCSSDASVYTKWLYNHGTHDATRLAEVIRDTAIEELAKLQLTKNGGE